MISGSDHADSHHEISLYFQATKSCDLADQLIVGKFLFKSTLFELVFQIVQPLK
ncbi:hypothetical protein HOF65_00975 [bacterium]|nr:hypothetical protein [bacterium]MBT3852615.1 hypothetical protein [bacterium]MBT4632918.1 hypothetical protein [bacterium]MBT6778861.1 hypothetical protein [bacterium]